MQRMRFLEAEKVITEKKTLHQEIMRRGLDFLTEIELGNAPPLEYVVKNIYQNRPPNSGNPNEGVLPPIPVHETVQSVYENLPMGEARLRTLMEDY